MRKPPTRNAGRFLLCAIRTQSNNEMRLNMNKPQINCAYTELVNINDLKANPRNPNRHPEEQIRLLAKIIEWQGWRRPITVSSRSGYIVRGHGALAAAKLAGCMEIPVDRQDYDSEEAEQADLIADNKIAELSSADPYLLAELLHELEGADFDVELAGFSAAELDKLNLQVTIPDDLEFKEYDEDTEKGVKRIICPQCGHEIPV